MIHVFVNSFIITLLPYLGDESFMLMVTVQSRLWYQTQILKVESSAKTPAESKLSLPLVING